MDLDSLFQIGDLVEREIDGSWFLGRVTTVTPGATLATTKYSIFYEDIGNEEAGVEEGEIRLSAEAPEAEAATTISTEKPKGLVLTSSRQNSGREDATDFSSKASEKESSEHFFTSQDSSGVDSTVRVHKVDDNERFQSTGTSYVVHGDQQSGAAAGGSGLRAIRMLRT